MERLILDGRVHDVPPGRPVPTQWREGYAVLAAFGRRAHWFHRGAPRAVSIDGVPQLITPVSTACGHTRFEVGPRRARRRRPSACRCARRKSKSRAVSR
ncbi:hypothetical protein WT09_30770 [Burkholderia stagnalis]|uniref:hypothetical protein n=1 Tax=Burkholderia stagnalis TaxID=1503054 RepID=UPI00075456C2|nr:hypothetical protein [Burkholderia stagnalis]KVN08209.1 hypothetical protein WT09_30770 [Burkholderia stagnalis]